MEALVKALTHHLPFIELNAWSIPSSTGTAQTAALALRKNDLPKETTSESVSAEEAVAKVLDQHFTVEAPFVTTERLMALRDAWGMEARKTVEEAHVLLFPSAAEQAEYPLDLFLEDLGDFLQKDPDKATLSLADAEDFLRQNQ
eukprot:symbB.v1.2.011507.t1/scaffold774.1/size163684/3